MGGSAKPPKQTDEQKRSEALSYKLMQEQYRQAKNPLPLPEIKPPPPIPNVAPPAQTISGEAEQAASAARRAAGNRTNAGKRTLFAGETGGYKPKTLLG